MQGVAEQAEPCKHRCFLDCTLAHKRDLFAFLGVVLHVGMPGWICGVYMRKQFVRVSSVEAGSNRLSVVQLKWQLRPLETG